MSKENKSFLDIYNEMVAKEDEKGFAELYKKVTEFLVKTLKNGDDWSDKSFNAKDLVYGDGYFIFGTGSNTRNEFHIEEIEGWLFGLWWEEPQVVKDKLRVSGTLFTQYEELIDKFKPSYSEQQWNIVVEVDKDENMFLLISTYNLFNNLTFMKEEPYLAFCRQYCGWDYNQEYHTRKEAKRKFKNWNREEHKNKVITNYLDKKVLKFYKRNILPLFDDSEIYDNGECIFPRYSLVVPFQSVKHLVNKSGCYTLFGDKPEDEAMLLGKKHYDKFFKKCHKIAKLFNVWWEEPIDPYLEVRKKSWYDLREKLEKELENEVKKELTE